MPLDPEKIRQLQALKNKPKPRGGRKAGGKGKVDTSVRTLDTWFALQHRFYDENNEKITCENPNCLDPREKNKGVMTVDIDGHYICRYCFLDGWLNDA